MVQVNTPGFTPGASGAGLNGMLMGILTMAFGALVTLIGVFFSNRFKVSESDIIDRVRKEFLSVTEAKLLMASLEDRMSSKIDKFEYRFDGLDVRLEGLTESIEKTTKFVEQDLGQQLRESISSLVVKSLNIGQALAPRLRPSNEG